MISKIKKLAKMVMAKVVVATTIISTSTKSSFSGGFGNGCSGILEYTDGYGDS